MKNYQSNIRLIVVTEKNGSKSSTGGPFTTLIPNIWYGNSSIRSQENAAVRISSMIKDVHARKISVKLSPTALYTGLENKFAN